MQGERERQGSLSMVPLRKKEKRMGDSERERRTEREMEGENIQHVIDQKQHLQTIAVQGYFPEKQ